MRLKKEKKMHYGDIMGSWGKEAKKVVEKLIQNEYLERDEKDFNIILYKP